MTSVAKSPDAAIRPRAILFDAGLTLIHASGRILLDELAAQGVETNPSVTAWDATRALVLAAEARHLPLPNALSGDLKVASTWAALMGLAGPEPAESCLRAMARPDFYTDLDPDAPDCLKSLLDEGLRLGVVSNSGGTLREDLAAFDLLGHFEVVVDSTEVGTEKPAPEIFHTALRWLGLPGSRCWYVGDGLVNDVLASRAAGYAAGILFDRFDCYAHLPGIVRIQSLLDIRALLPRP
jgi:putative hydrolase of the HAD superfamily